MTVPVTQSAVLLIVNDEIVKPYFRYFSVSLVGLHDHVNLRS